MHRNPGLIRASLQREAKFDEVDENFVCNFNWSPYNLAAGKKIKFGA